MITAWNSPWRSSFRPFISSAVPASAISSDLLEMCEWSLLRVLHFADLHEAGEARGSAAAARPTDEHMLVIADRRAVVAHANEVTFLPGGRLRPVREVDLPHRAILEHHERSAAGRSEELRAGDGAGIECLVTRARCRLLCARKLL